MVAAPAHHAGLIPTVLAISKTDVWFAGDDSFCAQCSGGFVEHWNGKRVSVTRPKVISPAYPDSLAGVRASSIWLLSSGWDEWWSLSHWNGRKWSNVHPPVRGADPWNAISARSKNDIWAVGDGAGDVDHWNGSRWHLVKASVIRRASYFDAVLDLAHHDVWAINGAHIYHFDGKAWKRTPGPTPLTSTTSSFPAIAGVPNGYVYVAGTSPKNRGIVLRWTGARWVRESIARSKRKSELSSISVGGNGDVWAGGDTYYKQRYNRSRALMEHYVACRRIAGR